MDKDIVKEALDSAKVIKKQAFENAKKTLVEAMSTNLKSVVTETLDEQLNEAGEKNQPADYHTQKKDKNLGTDRVGDEVEAQGDTPNDDPAEKGDGPAIIEAGLEEEELDEMDLDIDDDDDIEEVGIGEDFGEEDDDDEAEVDINIDADGDDDMGGEEELDIDVDDDEEDMEEVIEIVDESEELDSDQIVEELVKLDRENKKLKKENKRMEKALITLTNKMNEVNLFNARLAATSDLFRRVTLTKEQKERVINIFDETNNPSEVKRTYKALREAYAQVTPQKKTIKKRNVQKVVKEEAEPVNEEYDRMAQLAGIIEG